MSPRAGLDTAAVVAAAAALSDAEGLGGLTLAGVAQLVGVRTPSLYNHVAGLDDLQRRLALQAIAELTEAARASAVGRSGEDALRAFAHAYRAFGLAHPGRYAAAARAPVPGDTQWEAAAAALLDVLTAVLRSYDLTGDDAVHAVRALRSALHGFVVLETGGGFGLPLDRDASFARLLDLVVAGLRGAERGAGTAG